MACDELGSEAVGFGLSEVREDGGADGVPDCQNKGRYRRGKERKRRIAIVQLGRLVDLLLSAPIETEAVDGKHDAEKEGRRCTLDALNRAQAPSPRYCAKVSGRHNERSERVRNARFPPLDRPQLPSH